MKQAASVLKVALVVTIALPLCALTAQAQAPTVSHHSTSHRSRLHVGCYDIASGTYSGDTVRGPATITACNLNTIRYSYQFGSATNYQAAQNLWSGLSALSTQNPTVSAPATTPAPAPAPLTKPPAPQPVARAVRKLPGPAPAAPTDPFAPVQQTIDQAQKVINSFMQANSALTGKLDAFSAPLTQLGADATTLKTYQDQANASIALVTEGGASLTAYLTSTSDVTSQLVEATQAQLAAGSPLMQGVSATWPSSKEVVSLQNSLANDTNVLNNTSAAFSGYAASELPAYQAAQTALTTAEAQINAAFSKFEASNQPSQAQQDEVSTQLKNLDAEIQIAQKNLASLNQMPALFTAAIAQCATASTSAAALAPSSTTYTNFAAAQAALLHWAEKMSATIAAWTGSKATPPTATDPFTMSRSADCEFAFSRTKDTVITLTRIDLTPGVTNPSPQTVLTVTVECTSPFSLSAGVVFSTIPDDEFTVALTPGTTGTSSPTNTIYETSKSNFHPLPLAMVNARFAEPNEHVAFYGSFGVAANIRDQSAGGSTAEYLMGPSIGLFRTMIITAGVHLGSRASVGQGYTVNSTVPTTVTSVPINTNYTAGFGLGISFTTP